MPRGGGFFATAMRQAAGSRRRVFCVALVIGDFRQPVLVDAELSALLTDPIRSILPTGEPRYGGIIAIATADFDRKGAVVGFKDIVLRFAHPRNMRPELILFQPVRTAQKRSERIGRRFAIANLPVPRRRVLLSSGAATR
jgi:hypothetical protein